MSGHDNICKSHDVRQMPTEFEYERGQLERQLGPPSLMITLHLRCRDGSCRSPSLWSATEGTATRGWRRARGYAVYGCVSREATESIVLGLNGHPFFSLSGQRRRRRIYSEVRCRLD